MNGRNLLSALAFSVFCALVVGSCAKGGTGTATPPGGCGSGLDSCGSQCVDLMSDSKNCGDCAHACSAGQQCSNGSCGCVQPLVLCGTACIDVQSDPAHCGGCTRPACAAGQVCSAGACGSTCGAGLTACAGGQCVNTQTNPLSCGGCGASFACANGLACVGGVCNCPTGQSICATTNTCTTAAQCPSGALGGSTGSLGGGSGSLGGAPGGLGGGTGSLGGMTGSLGGAGGSARACAITDTNVISDFEEGSGVMVKQGGRTGFWYTYADACPTPPANSYTCTTTGASSQTPPAAPAAMADKIAVAASGSTDMCNKFAFHSTATNHSAFVGFGASFVPPAPPSTSMIKGAYDVSAYDGISFSMKSGGALQPPVLFEMLTKENQPDTQGGSIPNPAAGASAAHVVTDLYNTRSVVINKTVSSWQNPLTTTNQTYYIPFGMLVPRWVPAQGGSKACPLIPGAGDPKCQAPGWVPTSALGFQISVLSDIPGSAGSYDLWIDDVKFYKNAATGVALDLPAPPNGGGKHPFPQNGSVGSCRKPVGPSVDGKFLVSAYNQWKARFVVASGSNFRVQRPEVNNDSVSEGIAYGMLISVYMNDKALFDGLWGYWKGNAVDQLLMTWQIPGGSGSATDADEDAAFAMLMASRQWTGSPSTDTTAYATLATNLMHAVLANDMSTSSPFILGGNNYKTNASLTGTTNPSYFAPAWYRVFATADTANAAAWTALANNTYTNLGNISASSAQGLYGAWCSNNCSIPASNQGSQNSTTDMIYQYDSHRIPFRIGLDFCWNGATAANGGTTASGYLAKTSAFFQGKSAAGIGRILDIYNRDGTDPTIVVSAPNSASIIGTAAVGAMSSATYATFLNDAYQAVFDMVTRGTLAPADPSGKTPYSYYNATVGMLTLLTMTGNFTVFAP
jgi:endo-1,4-beta-D-glucanase Y